MYICNYVCMNEFYFKTNSVCLKMKSVCSNTKMALPTITNKNMLNKKYHKANITIISFKRKQMISPNLEIKLPNHQVSVGD